MCVWVWHYRQRTPTAIALTHPAHRSQCWQADVKKGALPLSAGTGAWKRGERDTEWLQSGSVYGLPVSRLHFPVPLAATEADARLRSRFGYLTHSAEQFTCRNELKDADVSALLTPAGGIPQ